jgi:hypothetical protein
LATATKLAGASNTNQKQIAVGSEDGSLGAKMMVALRDADILYPMIEEWRQRRLDVKRLESMGRHAALGHRWDAARGRWTDE